MRDRATKSTPSRSNWRAGLRATDRATRPVAAGFVTPAYQVTPGTRVLYEGQVLTITGLDAPYYSRVIARDDSGRRIELDMLALVTIPGPPAESAALALPVAA